MSDTPSGQAAHPLATTVDALCIIASKLFPNGPTASPTSTVHACQRLTRRQLALSTRHTASGPGRRHGPVAATDGEPPGRDDRREGERHTESG
jgi:hypothetical protein